MMKAREWGSYEKPLNTVDFESPSHSGTLLSGLNSLRSKGDLFDVTLLAEGESFRAHRVVLAACSDYFRAMFTDAMKESRQSEICLNGVTAEGIRLLLNYAYTSRLALNLANIQDVLSAASHVQVVAVVEACSNYLQSQLDLENCVDIATIAETYSLVQLRRRVYRFISGHLLEFSTSNEFQRLAPQQLEYLLACEFPVDCSEEEVLRIVLKWFNNSDICGFPHRFSYAARLLRKIHFYEIPTWKVCYIFQKMFMDRMSMESITFDKILMREAIRQTMSTSNSLDKVFSSSHSNNLVNSRGMELAIIKVGGFSIGGITNEITYCLSKGKWRHLTSIPHVEQCNFGTAVLDNELYVVGGSFNQSLQENIHPFGFRYSPRYNKWTTIAPMQRERCRFSLNVLKGCLYAIGGSSELEEFVDGADQEEISSCECYNPATDSWTSICPLPEGRSQHASVTWSRNNTDQYLFISGGLERDIISDTVRKYDPVTDSWQAISSMLTPRADHVMLAIENHIYVCGGWFEDTDIGNRVLVDTIDAYDVSTDTWKVVTRIPTPRYHAGIVEVDNKIYFIGGFHSDAMFDRDTAAIECYDVKNDFWTTEEKYPQDVWEHTCVTLYIPKCRDDMEVLATADNHG